MERVAIVGSREGADIEHVREFVRALREKHPDTILLSGGAKGVDQTAEQEWLALGGRVESLRVVQLSPEEFGIEKWELGGDHPRVYVLVDEPTWGDYRSALGYRTWLIGETSDRLVAFYRAGKSRGTSLAVDRARACHHPVYEFEPR